MTGGADIFSNVTESLKEIYEAHWETGNEVNSQSGLAIMEATRRALSSNKTFWDVEYEDGVKRFVKTNTPRPMGRRTDKNGNVLGVSLQNFIQYRTYATKGTTVVTAPMKQGYTEVREKGKVVGKTKVHNVGEGTINILRKINFGLNDDSSRINRSGQRFNWQGKPSAESFKGTHKATNFIEKGRRDSFGEVQSLRTQGFKDALARREKNIKPKMKKVA